MGRSELIWGPTAHEFRPSRWLGGEKSKSLNKSNPFHLGPRACVGQGFALLQATTIMGLVLKNFEVKLVEPGRLPAYGSGMTLPMVGGLPIRVSRRIHRVDVKA
jgi:cytochrome P450